MFQLLSFYKLRSGYESQIWKEAVRHFNAGLPAATEQKKDE
jgi:hypothetical protein